VTDCQLASVLVDRFGLVRLPQRPIAGLRLAGVETIKFSWLPESIAA
jgi:uncharacterized membrane protein YdcZ (DUF606 family)